MMLRTDRVAQKPFRRKSSVACCCLILLLAGCERQPTKTARNIESPSGNDSPSVVLVEPEVAPSLSKVESPPPELDPLQIRQQATLALESGKEDLAFELARQVIRLTPEDPQSVFLMARLLGQRHRFPEAIVMLDRLAVTTPEAKLPILGQTAQWMVQFGQYSEAEQRYRAILHEVPEAALVHRNLARLFVRQGRRMEAAERQRMLCRMGDIEEIELRHLLMIGRAFPGDAVLEELSPIGQRGNLLHKISQGDWAAARSYAEKLDSIEPDAMSLLGRIHVNLNDHQALGRWCNEPSRFDLESSDVWFAKAAWAANQNDHADAVRMLCETVLRDPTDQDAYALLGQSLAELKMEMESNAATKRAGLIATTQTLGSEMSQSPERDDAKLSLLIETLDELQRPQESLRWCGVRLSYGRSNGSLSDADMDALTKSIERRVATLRSKNSTPSREFLLCGIDLDLLPAKEAEDPERNDSSP